MTDIRTLPTKNATGHTPAGAGMRRGFAMQVRGNPPVSGGRLAP
jgi:hypothetical protein